MGHCDHCSKVEQLLNQFARQIAEAGLSSKVADARSHSSSFHHWVEETLELDDEHRFTAEEVVEQLRQS